MSENNVNVNVEQLANTLSEEDLQRLLQHRNSQKNSSARENLLVNLEKRDKAKAAYDHYDDLVAKACRTFSEVVSSDLPPKDGEVNDIAAAIVGVMRDKKKILTASMFGKGGAKSSKGFIYSTYGKEKAEKVKVAIQEALGVVQFGRVRSTGWVFIPEYAVDPEPEETVEN